MITGRIALTALKHVIEDRKGQGGKMVKCITIPLPPNYLDLTEKGNVFLDFSAFETRKDGTKVDEPIINQSPSKEIREQLKAAGQYPATLGNLKFWSNEHAPAPVKADLAAATEEVGDLPF